LVVHRANGEVVEVPLTLRLDTPMEVEYARHGSIMSYVLSELTRRPPARVA
jgi:aconitate hydratase